MDRSILAWEKRIEEAEKAAYERARDELRGEYEQRLEEAEQALASAEQQVADGVQQAEQRLAEQWQSSVQSLSACMDQLAKLRSEALRAGEGECLRLALALAARMLHRQLASDEQEWMRDALAAGLEDLPARHGIRVCVNPEVATVIEGHLDAALQSMEDAPSRPIIHPDPSLRLGSCRIECQGTIIDVGLQGAWERVVNHLLRQAPSQDLREEITADSGPSEIEVADDSEPT